MLTQPTLNGWHGLSSATVAPAGMARECAQLDAQHSLERASAAFPMQTREPMTTPHRSSAACLRADVGAPGTTGSSAPMRTATRGKPGVGGG